MLADEVDYVIGVDTQRDEHTLAVVVAPTGAVLAQKVVRASVRGYADALRFAERHAGGVRAWAVEDAGHCGAGLTRYLSEHGETVLEVGRQAVLSGDCAAKTTHSTRSAQHVPARGRDADPATRGSP
jgi:transposase